MKRTKSRRILNTPIYLITLFSVLSWMNLASVIECYIDDSIRRVKADIDFKASTISPKNNTSSEANISDLDSLKRIDSWKWDDDQGKLISQKELLEGHKPIVGSRRRKLQCGKKGKSGKKSKKEACHDESIDTPIFSQRRLQVKETALNNIFIYQSGDENDDELFPGDSMVFENELFSSDFGQRVGVSTGSCVLSSVETWTCVITLLFNLGQIMLEGRYFQSLESSVIAVTGGTDFFLGATGAAMVIFPLPPTDLTEIPVFEFRINLILTDFNN